MAIVALRAQALVAFCLSFGFVVPAAQSSPIEKVLDLLSGLEVQLTKEGKDEAANYDKYACFCKEQIDVKLYAIDKSEKEVKVLEAEIEALATEISNLDSAAAALGREISEAEGKKQAATTARTKENEDFLKTKADREYAIEHVIKAIKAIKNAKAGMQGDTKLDLTQAKVVVKKLAPFQTSLLARLEQVPSSGAPHDYTYQSNEIIETLQDVVVIFKANLRKLEEDEAMSKQSYDLEMNALSNTIKFKTDEKKEKEEISAAKSEEKAEADQEKAEETADMEADEKFMSTLKTDCEEKAQLWDQRSKSRADELTAISTAISSLKEKVAPNWGANKKLSDLQKAKKRPFSFLQVRGSVKNNDVAVQKVQSFLTKAASRLSSSSLTSAALRVMASKDYFVKVRGLIKDLIAKLKADASDEDATKRQCDQDMNAAMDNRDSAASDKESAAASIAKLESSSAKLATEVATLRKEVADLTKELQEATELRDAEKAENTRTITMSEEAIEGVNFAISTLEGYYGAALLQGKYVPPNSDRDGKTVQDLSPNIFQKTYSGAGDASKGIMGFLEVIQADFTRTKTTTKDEEEAAEGEFREMEANVKTAINNKNEMVTTKEATIASNKVALSGKKDDFADAEKTMGSASKALEILQEKCVALQETYQQRVQKREEEIAAAKQALQILIDWKAA